MRLVLLNYKIITFPRSLDTKLSPVVNSNNLDTNTQDSKAQLLVPRVIDNRNHARHIHRPTRCPRGNTLDQRSGD